MSVLKTIAVFAALILSLSACGGGSTVPAASFDQLSDQYDTRRDNFANLRLTPAAKVPTSGRTTYSGTFRGSIQEPVNTGEVARETIAGKAEITVNFGRRGVKGRIHSVVGETLGAINGDVTFNGESNFSRNLFNGTYRTNLDLPSPDGRPRTDVRYYGPATTFIVGSQAGRAATGFGIDRIGGIGGISGAAYYSEVDR